MSATALVWSVSLVALLVVLVLAGMQAARTVRELRRMTARLKGYAELPVLAPVRDAVRNVHRLEAAMGRIDPLMERADRALGQIRRGPIAPDSIAAVRRFWRALASLRTFAKR